MHALKFDSTWECNILIVLFKKFQGVSLYHINNDWLSSKWITNLMTWLSAFQVLLLNGLLLQTIIHLEQASVRLQHNWPTLSEAGSHLRLKEKN